MTQLAMFHKGGICATCSEALTESTWTLRDVLIGEVHTFCSKSCAESYVDSRVAKLRDDIVVVSELMLESITEEEANGSDTRRIESEDSVSKPHARDRHMRLLRGGYSTFR